MILLVKYVKVGYRSGGENSRSGSGKKVRIRRFRSERIRIPKTVRLVNSLKKPTLLKQQPTWMDDFFMLCR
jgi:hypothetical protein